LTFEIDGQLMAIACHFPTKLAKVLPCWVELTSFEKRSTAQKMVYPEDEYLDFWEDEWLH
jgi:hypothetical protein